MLANVKVPSIPTSAACCDYMQLTNVESSSYNRQLLNQTCVLQNTDTSSYLQLPVNYFIGLRLPKHRYLSLVIYNRQLLHRTASSFKPLM